MSNKKVIFSDLDGTLIAKGERSINEELKQEIVKWKATHDFIISTGRLYAGTKYFLDALALDGYTVCCSGAVIYKNGEIVRETCVDKKIVKRVWDLSNDMDGYCQIYTDGKIVANKYSDLAKSYGTYKEKYGDKYAVDIEIARTFEDINPSYKAHKLSFVSDGDYAEVFLDRLGDLEGVNMFRSLSYLYDIVSSDASKGKAIDWFRARNFADKYFAIGDNENDMSMICNADYSAAMGNATDNIKSMADVVVSKVELNGLVEFIKIVDEL